MTKAVLFTSSTFRGQETARVEYFYTLEEAEAAGQEFIRLQKALAEKDPPLSEIEQAEAEAELDAVPVDDDEARAWALYKYSMKTDGRFFRFSAMEIAED